MYDDDSENSQKGVSKAFGNVAKGATGGVKRVARGTRRLSLVAAGGVTKAVTNAPGNVKNLATNMPGNVKNLATNMPSNMKKAGAATVKGTVGTVGAVAQGAGNLVITGNMKGKKKKKKKKKKKEKPSRGRSESPRRTTNSNSKPPVTKVTASAVRGSVKGLKSMFKSKRWRSASPAINRGKNKVGPEEELEPLPVAPAKQQSFRQPAVNGGGGGGGYGGGGGFEQQQRGGGLDNMQTNGNDQGRSSIGVSLRSMSTAQRDQRNHQQEKIERDNLVPFVSGLLHSGHFVKFCDGIFIMVDANGDGAVDETELYAGLLLIHLKIGSFLGPAACRPLSRERCTTMFKRFDTTGRGGLDKTEFRRVMMVLFANVFARVLVQFALTIVIVPLAAQSVLNCLTLDTEGWWDYWTKPKYLRRLGEEFTLDGFVDWNVTSFPSSRRNLFTRIFRFFRVGSDQFWETFPLTFMTIILGLVIAPLMLYLIDDLFHHAVAWNDTRRVKSRKR